MSFYDIFATIWLFTAAGLANSAPVFANKIPLLNQWRTPIDFGIKFRNRPLFGKNKTWRGLLFGTLISVITIYTQKAILILLDADITINGVSFMSLPTLSLGLLLGLGPLVGDFVESFFKRQIGVKPGSSWFPFDQLDYIIGAVIFTLPLIQLSLLQYLSLFIIGFGIHLIASYVGYLLKLKDAPI